MKKFHPLLTVAVLIFTALSACAQMGGPAVSPVNALAKVFGTNLNFSATIRAETRLTPQNQTISTPGKIYFSDGNWRSEIDMTKMTGAAIPPQAMAQMKAMGMGSVIFIQQQNTKTAYMIYPGLKAYAKVPTPDTDSSTNNAKVDTVDLGQETVDGHPCDKKQFVATDASNGQHQTVTVWLATDLKNVPIQSEQTTSGENGAKNFTVVHFTDISLTKPDASLFMPPTGFTAYDDIHTMMQTEMMKKMGGGMAMPH